jgi:hypothetical protein
VAIENGQLIFFDDIYGHDAALAHALANRYTEPPGGDGG